MLELKIGFEHLAVILRRRGVRPHPSAQILFEHSVYDKIGEMHCEILDHAQEILGKH